MSVTHNGYVRAGIVKVGDRVLEINGCNMKNCSQFDALTILRGASEMVTMVIEYEVELQGNSIVLVLVQNLIGLILQMKE